MELLLELQCVNNGGSFFCAAARAAQRRHTSCESLSTLFFLYTVQLLLLNLGLLKEKEV